MFCAEKASFYTCFYVLWLFWVVSFYVFSRAFMHRPHSLTRILRCFVLWRLHFNRVFTCFGSSGLSLSTCFLVLLCSGHAQIYVFLRLLRPWAVALTRVLSSFMCHGPHFGSLGALPGRPQKPSGGPWSPKWPGNAFSEGFRTCPGRSAQNGRFEPPGMASSLQGWI